VRSKNGLTMGALGQSPLEPVRLCVLTTLPFTLIVTLSDVQSSLYLTAPAIVRRAVWRNSRGGGGSNEDETNV
jgi:hypothetical protein